MKALQAEVETEMQVPGFGILPSGILLRGCEEKRRHLMEVAESLFVEKGYSAATMEEVARRAHVSKKTIYTCFPSKEVLLQAVIAARHAQLQFPIEGLAGEPEDILIQLIRHTALFILSEREIALHRLVATRCRGLPDLARAFDFNGIEHGRSAVEQYIARLAAEGVCRIGDAGEVTRMLLGMAIGDLYAAMLLGLIARPDPVVLDCRVRLAVQIFLKGTRPEALDRFAPPA